MHVNRQFASSTTPFKRLPCHEMNQNERLENVSSDYGETSYCCFRSHGFRAIHARDALPQGGARRGGSGGPLDTLQQGRETDRGTRGSRLCQPTIPPQGGLPPAGDETMAEIPRASLIFDWNRLDGFHFRHKPDFELHFE